MTVCMQSGRIYANFLSSTNRDLEIETNLAIVFGIAALHVILQPKPVPYLSSDLSQNSSHPKLNPYYLTKETPSSSNPIRLVPLTSYSMLNCIGFTDLVCLPSFYALLSNMMLIQQDKQNDLNSRSCLAGGNGDGDGDGGDTGWLNIGFIRFEEQEVRKKLNIIKNRFNRAGGNGGCGSCGGCGG